MYGRERKEEKNSAGCKTISYERVRTKAIQWKANNNNKNRAIALKIIKTSGIRTHCHFSSCSVPTITSHFWQIAFFTIQNIFEILFLSFEYSTHRTQLRNEWRMFFLFFFQLQTNFKKFGHLRERRRGREMYNSQTAIAQLLWTKTNHQGLKQTKFLFHLGCVVAKYADIASGRVYANNWKCSFQKKKKKLFECYH